MEFENFIKENKVRKSSIDYPLIRSLTSSAENDLKFLNTLEINQQSARKVMSDYYEVLRSLIEAIAMLNGYKVYSHEAFTYFLMKINENNAGIKFDRLRKIRNGINYYGKDISAEETTENVKDLIKYFKEKHLDKTLV